MNIEEEYHLAQVLACAVPHAVVSCSVASIEVVIRQMGEIVFFTSFYKKLVAFRFFKLTIQSPSVFHPIQRAFLHARL